MLHNHLQIYRNTFVTISIKTKLTLEVIQKKNKKYHIDQLMSEEHMKYLQEVLDNSWYLNVKELVVKTA